MFFDSTATSKEGDNENETSDHNQKNWCVEELVAQEIQVLAVESLNYSTNDN